MKKNKYFIGMFNAGTIVKVLVPNVVNTGYDYRLTAPADIGAFVGVTIMNRPYIGVVWGFGDSGLPESKIKMYIIPTNEAAYMIKKAAELIDQQ